MNDNIELIFSKTIGQQFAIKNELLKNHTSFKIGGPCDLLLMPGSLEELVDCIRIAKEYEQKYYIIGNGSNLLVLDTGLKGIVIKTDRLKKCDIFDTDIEAETGILLKELSQFAQQNALCGFEFASGIPGTLGGAIYMNAGAYDGEMSFVIKETTYLNSDGETVTLNLLEHEFGYRKSIFQNNGGIILKSKISLKKGKKEEILAIMEALNSRRCEKQPLEMPSGGSTFRRPTGHFAGKLIMDAGLKGFRVGGAMVSDKHAGFVVNAGDASAKDVLTLVEIIKNKVFNEFGVELLLEIKILGKD